MSDSSGFIDLRVGQAGRGVGDESIWPSFTDIMTVIVMIFLMALVVIMVRNFELDRELMSTISAKEQTAIANQDLSQQLLNLETSLSDTRSQRDKLQSNLRLELQRIAQLGEDQTQLQTELESLVQTRENLQLQNQQLQDQKQKGLQEIEKLTASELSLSQALTKLTEQFSQLELQSNTEITALSADKKTLGEKLDTVSEQLTKIKVLLQESESNSALLDQKVSRLQQQNQGVEEKYSIANEEILALTELIQQREAENTALQAHADNRNRQYQSLQQEFESLDEKYRDLIRPARSTAGKYIVEVVVEKTDLGMQYKLREPQDSERRNLTKAQLSSTLADLKNRFSENLYTRIIIPGNSRLTHNEAWEFTQEILNKYDYYYQ